VKPFELLGEALLPDGSVIKLTRRSDEYLILAAGATLMSSRTHASEETLATLACKPANTLKQSAVLIGGLGMGFTLRAALELLPQDTTVIVAELIPEVVAWNRGPLGHLAGHPLHDHRVRIEITDVADTLSSSPAQFDVIILDVDNGPAAFTAAKNATLYDHHGIAAAHRALKPRGILAVWAAQPDSQFQQRLRSARFEVQIHPIRGHRQNHGPRHTIYLARRS